MTNSVPLTQIQFVEISKFLSSTIPQNDEFPPGVNEYASELIVNFLKTNKTPNLCELRDRFMIMFYLGKAYGNEELRQKIEEIINESK